MRTWEDNAEEFGSLIRQDKDLQLAALVACSAERVVNQYGFSEEKASLNAFAKRANCSIATVSRYFRMWEHMANAGVVPLPEMLTPNDVESLTLPAKVVEAWSELETNAVVPRMPQRTPEDEAIIEAMRMEQSIRTLIERWIPALELVPQMSGIARRLDSVREQTDFALIQLRERATVNGNRHE